MSRLPDRLRARAGRLRHPGRWLSRTTVRVTRPGNYRASRWCGLRRWVRRPDDPSARPVMARSGTLRLVLPDAASLVRLATAGLLAGHIHRLRVRLGDCPWWLTAAVRPPRLASAVERFRWQRRGRGLTIDLAWSRPRAVHLGLADAVSAVLRVRRWEQFSGPVPALDRGAWLDGRGTWPHGQLLPEPSRPDTDDAGRPVGPHPALPPATAGAAPPLITAVANPFGRVLFGAATRYHLTAGHGGLLLRDADGRVRARLPHTAAAEAAVASADVVKYAVVTVADGVVSQPGAWQALRALAACGMVVASADPAVRASLTDLGLVVVDDATDVDDLPGYALSVASARRAAITGDAALRRTELAGAGALPLPTVSVLLASIRRDQVERCLGYLAAQDYPAMEVLVGSHGYRMAEEAVRRWAERFRVPLRVHPFPAELTLGAVLGRLTRLADGEIISKVDDDDHYGRHHVTDLVIAWHTTGADLVGKGARFVHFPELDRTVDRAWAAPEGFDVSPAGGTLLLGRGSLAQVGGWSHSSRHVDEDLLIRIRNAGGLTFRTHALEYVYVRRSSGHTFLADTDELIRQGQRVYSGLPGTIIRTGAPDTSP